MKKTLFSLLVIAVIGGGAYAYYRYRETAPKPTVATATVTRGDVVETVGATGTLQAVTTVQVGTQVSGTIQSLYADFNSLVKKGQILARLDPSLFETQIEQAKANLIRAQADLERLRVTLDDARTKLARARELSQRQLIPKSELDTAEVNVRSAEAQIRSSEAQVTQAQASLNQNQVNLAHTVIEAPIDGLVISRNVDVGQTVAASMQAPTLFVLAADLTKMQVVANLDESDVGRIRPGQTVPFRVDAYPTDTFIGVVSQVRLEPKVQQNVVTYATVIDVPNNQLKLKPGMTANVNVEIAKSTNVLRIPNAALRFRPTNEIYAALGQTPPDPGQLRTDFGGGRRGGDAPPSPGQPVPPSAQQPSSSGPPRQTTPPGRSGAPTARGGETQRSETPNLAPTQRGEGAPSSDANAAGRSGDVNGGGRAGDANGTSNREGGERREGFGGGRGAGFGGGGRGGSGGRGGNADANQSGGDRFAARMQNLSPEEREQMLQRMRERGIDPNAPSGRGGFGSRGRGGQADAAPSGGRGGQPESTTSRGRGGQQTRAATAAPSAASASPRPAGATTIDALFGPLPRTESVGRVWLYADNQLRPVRLRLGISDGQNTELIEGDLQQGTEVVTNVTTGAETRPNATTGFPFGQPGRGRDGFPGGGFPGGGFGGGNRGGGGGRGGGR